jgi:hypothetical protein
MIAEMCATACASSCVTACANVTTATASACEESCKGACTGACTAAVLASTRTEKGSAVSLRKLGVDVHNIAQKMAMRSVSTDVTGADGAHERHRRRHRRRLQASPGKDMAVIIIIISRHLYIYISHFVYFICFCV